MTYTRPAPDKAEVRRLAREDAGKLSDALTFRLAVESGAADVLAGHFAATREDRIEAVLAAKLAEVNAAGPADYRRLDTLFHLSIAELAGSSLLSAACADARMRLNDLLNAIPVLQRNIDHTAGQHRRSSKPSWPATRSRRGPRWPSTWPEPPRCSAASSVSCALRLPGGQ